MALKTVTVGAGSEFPLENLDASLQGKQVFFFKGRDILLTQTSVGLGDLSFTMLEDSAFNAVAVELPSDFVPTQQDASLVPLRTFFASRPAEEAALASRMKALLNWNASFRFCPSCGAPLEFHKSETAKVCTSCGKMHFPKIEPCIITVIHRGDEMLLLRHALRNQDMYCCLAGFVEAGESLEHALVREIREEVGLEVTNIRYAGSQGWPFPSQLMIGFHADYLSGEVKVQESEIAEAAWFRKDSLPDHPQPGSISWELIHA